MEYRIGRAKDIPGVLELQAENLVSQLREEEKRDGFVTTPFTTEQLETLIALKGLFVADDGRIRGYAVAAGWDYFVGRPMFELMLKRFSAIQYRGFAIDAENSFEYGPVCVDKTLRGSGVFPSLFSYHKEVMAERYPVGTTFINVVNGRSFRAHTDKAGLDLIDEFSFNDNRYYGLAFLTR